MSSIAKKTKTAKPLKKPHTRKKKPSDPRAKLAENLPLLLLEALALLTATAFCTMLALGHVAGQFTGSDFLASLLPFALGVAGLILLAALLLILWLNIRRNLQRAWRMLPAVLALALAFLSANAVLDQGYAPVFNNFRALVGGKALAAKTTLAHQVYAAYRRYDTDDLQTMVQRSQGYHTDIQEAAQYFGLDVNILLGVAATESSFLPRDSQDGGHGLFQITAVPKFLLDQARQPLHVDKLDMANPRHNAFVAAATLKHYLAQMNNDLFLGLLAYNIGPKNGGLQFIMQQYGATDFITMQPYLQQLPRDYPVRVLSYALAFRIWQHNGKLLAYQEGDNAAHIQKLGIPGLSLSF